MTEKARTDSTGRPGDPDFKFLKKCNPTAQTIVFDSKIQFLRYAEYDHRLKIKIVVVTDQKQVLTKAFAIVTFPSPVFVVYKLV